MIHSFYFGIALTDKAVLCPITLSTLLIGFIWAVIVALRDGITRLQKLHRIPCDRCVYFTGCHYLKCTVHPHRALTEEAVDCLDFEPAPTRKPFYKSKKRWLKTRSIQS
ncbi:hypothetical protein [Leptolyngbya sp. NK1-12]|uniref:hypothetical protein n=1 Tax=Leptolyngbya sp. NK1-12 TaxID=2547451 RepID=UPI00292D50B9|nr:hypothetical protein [Leptolyngbya sp. NK1-12]